MNSNHKNGKSKKEEKPDVDMHIWDNLRREMRTENRSTAALYREIMRRVPEESRERVEVHLARMCRIAMSVGMERGSRNRSHTDSHVIAESAEPDRKPTTRRLRET